MPLNVKITFHLIALLTFACLLSILPALLSNARQVYLATSLLKLHFSRHTDFQGTVILHFYFNSIH